MILGRSLREAFYLTSFDVKTLPYVTAGVAILGLPVIGLFSRLLTRYGSRTTFKVLLIVLGAGLGILWPFLERFRPAVALFYLWTALGEMVLTSGFWVITSEQFALRGAKRLFGLIGAGGTLGAMMTGLSLPWLTRNAEVVQLVPLLIAILILFFLSQFLLPQPLEDDRPGRQEKTSIREGLTLVWKNRHLRTIGLVVMTATMASTLLDYRFKELARASLTTKASLTGFFGSFYGWTGAVSFVIQILVSSRLMAWAGIARSLAVLPCILLAGSAGLLALPSLLLTTLVRGADNSLRKSLHRSVLEVLFVPLSPDLRRKTKGFIDSVFNSLAEGAASGVIFLWVTLAGLSSGMLNLFIIGLAACLLFLSRRMGRQYLQTLVDQLKEGRIQEPAVEARFEGRDLLSATLTRIDLKGILKGLTTIPSAAKETSPDTLARIISSDTETVSDALPLPTLIRLLARDDVYHRAAEILAGLDAVPTLLSSLKDPETDFVIRRRIPAILSRIGGPEADDALLDILRFPRFEVRYRAAIALVRRRRQNLPHSSRNWQGLVWEAIRFEVTRERPVWEMQRLLDTAEEKDELARHHVEVRGGLSLEHVFRLLTLLLDPLVVRTAYRGLLGGDSVLKSVALEYLEQALPEEIRKKLWPFIGDLSETQQARAIRPLPEVAADLVRTGATLFASGEERESLKKVLDPSED